MAQTVRADDSGKERRNHFWSSTKYNGFGNKTTSVNVTSYIRDDGSHTPASVSIWAQGKRKDGEDWKGNVTIDAADIPGVIEDLKRAQKVNDEYFAGKVGKGSYVNVPDALKKKV